jgi:Domain of unknown function DUF11
LAAGVLSSLPASASTSADLATTVTPASQQKTQFVGTYPPTFTFTAVVTNNGPNPASAFALSIPGYSFAKVGFSVSPTETCTTSTTSGRTFTCAELPVHGTMTAAISFRLFCLGHICSGGVTATVSSTTPDPNPANNSASGTWVEVCSYRNCGP